MHPLILSAAAFECRPLTEALVARHIGFDFVALGIGPFAGGDASRKLRSLARGREVLFIGTCGIFAGFKGPEIIRCAEVRWSPTCERLGLSYQVPSREPAIPIARGRLSAGLPEKIVLSCPNISLTPELGKDFLQSPPDGFVENLELYRAMRDLYQSAASIDVLLGITNQVGPGAHAEWLANHAECSRMTAEFVLSQIGKRRDG